MEGRSQLGRLPHTVWALGFVSMFMDISSEMIHSLLPVFLVVTLGASTEVVGANNRMPNLTQRSNPN